MKDLGQTFLRVKWNISGTCFAGSGEDGSVTLWQRNVKQKFDVIANLKSK